MNSSTGSTASLKQQMSHHGRRALPALLAAVAITMGGLFPSGTAQAAINAVSPLRNFANFPLWYRDLAVGGNQIQLCLGLNPDGTGLPDPLCVLPTVAPLEPNYNPTLPFVFPTNFPSEAFYWIAEAEMLSIGTGGGRARLRCALEAAFGTGTPAVDQQMTFLRINLGPIDGLAPNSDYTVTHPYGTFTITTDLLGTAANFRLEDGALPIALLPTAFEVLLPATTTLISSLLEWDVGAPAGYLGDGATPHTVIGGTNGNVFTIAAATGDALLADIDPVTVGVQTSITTNLFVVSGKLFAPTISEVTPVPTPTNVAAPIYTFTTNDTGTITYGGDCTSATTAAVLGFNTVTFAALADGLHSNCTITVTNIAGNVSNLLAVTPFTIDTVVPVIAEVTPIPNPTNVRMPNYTFNTSELGTIAFFGDCSSVTTSAIAGPNVIKFNPLPAGLHTDCAITVTDPATNVSTPIFITHNYVNRAPVLGAVANQEINEGQPLAFTLSATDDLGDALTFGATALPAGASVNPTSGAFSWKPGFNQAGSHLITLTVTDNGDPLLNGTAAITVLVNNVRQKNDFDGDGRSDIGCYFPPGGDWFEFRSAEGFIQTQFGFAGTLPVTGDFDADGKSDIGAYNAAGGNWYLFKSAQGFAETTFGFAGTIPVVGDFDGDGKSDIGAYFAETGSWYLFKSTEGFMQTQFGFAGTIPVVGDFDGDGRDDIGAYYPTGGNWYLFKSTEGFFETAFGFAGTIPVVGDFDGDGRDDIGVYNPPGGDWFLFKSAEGFFQTQFGYAGTEPVVGDFDGDRRDDIAVYYAPGGNWYMFKSAEGFMETTFGFDGTIPLGGTLR